MFFIPWHILVPVGLMFGILGVVLSRRSAFYGQTVALLGCIMAVVSALWHVVDMRVYDGNSELLEKRYAVLEYKMLAEELRGLSPAPKGITYLWSGEDDLGKRVLESKLSGNMAFSSRRVAGENLDAFLNDFQAGILESSKESALVLSIELPEGRSMKEYTNLLAGRDFVLVNPVRIDQEGSREIFEHCRKDTRNVNGRLLMIINRKDDVRYDVKSYPSSRKKAFDSRFWIQRAE